MLPKGVLFWWSMGLPLPPVRTPFLFSHLHLSLPPLISPFPDFSSPNPPPPLRSQKPLLLDSACLSLCSFLRRFLLPLAPDGGGGGGRNTASPIYLPNDQEDSSFCSFFPPPFFFKSWRSAPSVERKNRDADVTTTVANIGRLRRAYAHNVFVLTIEAEK